VSERVQNRGERGRTSKREEVIHDSNLPTFLRNPLRTGWPLLLQGHSLALVLEIVESEDASDSKIIDRNPILLNLPYPLPLVVHAGVGGVEVFVVSLSNQSELKIDRR